MTILMKASLRGLRNIVSLLIDRGANLDLVAQAKSKLTVSGTALLFAVLSGHLPIVKLLLSAGADVNIRDNVTHATSLSPYLTSLSTREIVHPYTMRLTIKIGLVLGFYCIV